jgi:hypothetical protein
MSAAITAPDFNYAWLIFLGLGEIPGYPGRMVPVLVFHHQAQEASVFILDTQRYSVPAYESLTGLRYQLHILGADGNPYQDCERFAYLVLHNSDDLAWLRPAEPPAT